MRVALVTNRWGVGGGVFTIAQWLSDGLLKHGHTVAIFNIANSGKDKYSRRLLGPSTWMRGPRLEPVSEGPPAVTRVGAQFVEFELFRYFPRKALAQELNQFDIVHVVSGGPILAFCVANVSAPKILHVATTAKSERPTRIRVMKPARRLVATGLYRAVVCAEPRALGMVDQVLVLNDWMQQWVGEHSATPVMKLTSGVDIKRFHRTRPWAADNNIIGLGRLGDPRKDWGTAVRAFELLVESGCIERNRLILAGKGPVPESLSLRVARSPFRDRIDICADLSSTDVVKVLTGSSVFLQSSLEEGLGIAGLEAMAAGLPVVSTATVGAAEYVRNGYNGYLVPLDEGDVGANLAQKLKVILTEDNSWMSENACETVRSRYSSVAEMDRLLALYESMRQGAGNDS